MKGIETNMPSAKAFNKQNTDEYIHYILYNWSALFSLYNSKPATFRFYSYQGRHRANTEFDNILLDGHKNITRKRERRLKRTERRRLQRKSTLN